MGDRQRQVEWGCRGLPDAFIVVREVSDGEDKPDEAKEGTASKMASAIAAARQEAWMAATEAGLFPDTPRAAPPYHPRTADGVLARPGMEVYFNRTHATIRKVCDGGEYGYTVEVEDAEGPQGWVSLSRCFSKPQ